MFTDSSTGVHKRARLAQDDDSAAEEFWEFGRYARLRRWLYGIRKAASGWEEDYAKRFEAEGFIRGKAAPGPESGPRRGHHGLSLPHSNITV